MTKTIKDLLILTLLCTVLSSLIWLPHILKLSSFYGMNFSAGTSTIYGNYDGLEYIVVAKSFYNPKIIGLLQGGQNAIYYASHFPLYPIFISVIAPIFGFLKSMILITSLFTLLSVLAFYKLVKDFNFTNHPLWLSIVFLILPARWVIVHSIGAPEPVFIFFTIVSVYGLLKFNQNLTTSSWIWLAAVSGMLAQLARPPGILLIVSYILYIHWRVIKRSKEIGFKMAQREHLRYAPLILIPLGLLGVFYFYGQTYGDFFAYFHSGDNIHLSFPPFQVFNKNQPWVGEIWLEDIVYIFIIGLLGGLTLIRQKLYPLAFFVLTYLAASLLVVHRDISRYTLPVIPFIIIAFEKVLVSREFKIVVAIMSLGIYLYAQNFLLNNVAPVSNLGIFK